MSQAFAYESHARAGSRPALAAPPLQGGARRARRDGWDAATQAFNLTVRQDPAFVAYPQDVQDVVAIVEFARAARLQVTAQRGGHNAEPYGSLDRDDPRQDRRLQGVSDRRASARSPASAAA